ncbi:hypothetical protein BCR42DRAFT_425599 [Absidia repens]|uniref:Uncharacterized protein n=1 Tax=Absidia repens TaxID=90262 RepID=A0A1X2I292_9FUNG|nr:hypothetical protein BCR42DRAFT_425599 [Absidia repens]
MKKDQAKTSKKSRNIKYSQLQEKRRKFFYSHNNTKQQKKPHIPPWPINVDSIRLCQKKEEEKNEDDDDDDDQQPSDTADDNDDAIHTHADQILEMSLQKLRESLDTKTPVQYKSTLNSAVDNTTNMIRAILNEIGKNERPSSQSSSSRSPPPEELNPLGYEDILLAALGAKLPPLVIQRALERMKAIVPPEDQVTEQIIQEACNPTDVYGAAGKSLSSAESIYGFISPGEEAITASLLPVENEFYKDEPTYMQSLRPSMTNGGMNFSTAVERDFLSSHK